MPFKSQATQEEPKYAHLPMSFWVLLLLFLVGVGYHPDLDMWQFWGMLGSGLGAYLTCYRFVFKSGERS